MQLITLPILALFITSALAADCLGAANKLVDHDKMRDAYWAARQKMCSNSDCAYQQTCTVQAATNYVIQSTKKDGPRFIKHSIDVSLMRKNTGGQKGFKDCWDATENIISQCVDGQEKLVGTWEYNGQLYQFDGQITTVTW